MSVKIRKNYLIIAAIFVIVTVASLLCVGAASNSIAYSALSFGDGTQQNPYRLHSAEQLYNLAEIAHSNRAKELTQGKYFVLCNDITYGAAIPDVEEGFYGTLDGNGHAIHLTSHGIFRRLKKGGKITNTNFVLENPPINAYFFGVVYEVEKGAEIENCNVSGAITFLDEYRGHNIGNIYFAPFCITNNGVIKNCTYQGGYNVVEVMWLFPFRNYFCGIAYGGSGTVENCTVNATHNFVISRGHKKAHYFFGISKCRAVNCTFNGNVCFDVVRITDYAGLSYEGISPNSTGCVFNGNVYVNKSDEKVTGWFEETLNQTDYSFNGSVCFVETLPTQR